MPLNSGPKRKSKNRIFFSYGKKIRGKRKLRSYGNVVKCVDDKYDKYDEIHVTSIYIFQ